MTEVTEAKKSTVEKIPVTMTDGRVVDFNKKQKLVKTSTIDEEAGVISLQMDFANGETRTFNMPASLILRFAAHGAEQKLGDATAGESDLSDAVLAVESLIKQLESGEWSAKREAGAFSGTSILIQALVEASGKTVEDIFARQALGHFDRTAKPRARFKEGQSVRLTTGAFAGFTATVLREKPGKRIEILFSILGGERVMRVDPAEVEVA